MSGHRCPRCGDDYPSSSNALDGTIGHLCDPVRSATRREIESILDAVLDGYAPGDTPDARTMADALLGAGMILPPTCTPALHRIARHKSTCDCGMVTVPYPAAGPVTIRIAATGTVIPGQSYDRVPE